MMAVDRLSVTDLAESLVDVLERAQGGEQIAVERDGEIIATIGPPVTVSGTTLRELALALARLPPLDEDFAADIAAVRANQLPAKIPEWPS
jgi:antitoxin (DNA-binding transcriptional repressor) of toxin-antitoxin stability system